MLQVVTFLFVLYLGPILVLSGDLEGLRSLKFTHESGSTKGVELSADTDGALKISGNVILNNKITLPNEVIDGRVELLQNNITALKEQVEYVKSYSIPRAIHPVQDTYAPFIAALNPTLWWDFNEVEAYENLPVIDISGNGHDCLFHPDTGVHRERVKPAKSLINDVGYAFQTPLFGAQSGGAAKYGVRRNSEGLMPTQSFSVSMWFEADSLVTQSGQQPTSMLFHMGGRDSDSPIQNAWDTYYLCVTRSTHIPAYKLQLVLRSQYGGTDQSVTYSNSTIELHTRYNVVVTWDRAGDKIPRIYLNGVLDGEGAPWDFEIMGCYTPTNLNFAVGYRESATSGLRQLYGRIDDFVMWSDSLVLSAADIAVAYNLVAVPFDPLRDEEE